jgi:hypothetical protein
MVGATRASTAGSRRALCAALAFGGAGVLSTGTSTPGGDGRSTSCAAAVSINPNGIPLRIAADQNEHLIESKRGIAFNIQ